MKREIEREMRVISEEKTYRNRVEGEGLVLETPGRTCLGKIVRPNSRNILHDPLYNPRRT